MLKKKINNQAIGRGMASFFQSLAEKAFLTFIILCIIVFFSAAMVFYFYAYLPTKSEPEAEVEKISIDEEIYECFISNYSQRKTDLYQEVYLMDSEDFKDIFYSD